MTDSLAPSARPPWALTIWSDTQHIYVELPGEPSPYVMKFAHTESALTKALALLRQAYIDHAPRGGHSTSSFVNQPIVRKVGQPKWNAEQRLAAKEALKKAGII